MAIPRQLVEDAPNPALEESTQIDEAASGSPQPTPEDILGTPNLDSTGDQLVGQGLGMQKNVMDSGPTDALLTGLNNQGKINAVGQAGAMQFHDRKYDNAASQKIYDDLNAQRSTQSANRQKTADSLLNKGLGLKKEAREVKAGAEKSEREQQEIDLKIKNMADEAARKGKEHEPVSAAVAKATADYAGEPVSLYLGKTPYEIKIIREGRSKAEKDAMGKIAGDKLDIARERNDIARSREEDKDEVRKRLSDKQTDAVSQYDNLIKFATGLDTDAAKFEKEFGVKANTINKGKRLINKGDPELNAYMNRVDAQVRDYIRAISGTASSEKEQAALVKLMPNMNDDYQTFKNTLRDFTKKAAEFRETHLGNAKKQGKDTSKFDTPAAETGSSDYVTVDDGSGPQRIPRKNLSAAQKEHPKLKVVGE